VKDKKVRLQKVNTLEFVENQPSHSRKVVWYYYKNLNNTQIYSEFFESMKSSLLETINKHNMSIKFNLKL